ncbi:hypothetical protein [Orenia marismortui]|uniref:Uncharacterized protein n=1 Tax=Orenia marismortui TaxID=46469 RepID=A0A4V6QBA5_9FIRM|nr:hypothetical protein [Orenia marismortui]TDX53291.1 hypothetical protein C7959_103144 [Orenia marismortui]
MKYNKEVSKLIVKLKEKKEHHILTSDNELLEGLKCPICECNIGDHEKYVHCEVIGAYICDTCCRYELCNDYQLVNKALGKEIFNANNEIIMLCEYCD